MNIHQSLILYKSSKLTKIKNYSINLGILCLSLIANSKVAKNHYFSGNEAAFKLLDYLKLNNFIFNDISKESELIGNSNIGLISKFLGIKKLNNVQNLVTVDLDVVLNEKIINLYSNNSDVFVLSDERSNIYVDQYNALNNVVREHAQFHVPEWDMDWDYSSSSMTPINSSIIAFKDESIMKLYADRVITLSEMVHYFCNKNDILSFNAWVQIGIEKQANEQRPKNIGFETTVEQLFLRFFCKKNNLSIQFLDNYFHDPIGKEGFIHLHVCKRLDSNYFLNVIKEALDYYQPGLFSRIQNIKNYNDVIGMNTVS